MSLRDQKVNQKMSQKHNKKSNVFAFQLNPIEVLSDPVSVLRDHEVQRVAQSLRLKVSGYLYQATKRWLFDFTVFGLGQNVDQT